MALPLDPAMVRGQSDFFAQPDSYAVDSRGVGYSFFFSAVKHLGAGQFYLVTITDHDGRPLEGSRSYRLTVPANAPVTQYWSATVYDRQTHGLIREQPRCTVASNTHGLTVKPDGSVDIRFGPHAPERDTNNWISTSAGRQFEVMFRFYGPTDALHENTGSSTTGPGVITRCSDIAGPARLQHEPTPGTLLAGGLARLARGPIADRATS